MPGYTPNIVYIYYFKEVYIITQLKPIYKIVKNLAPRYLTELLPKLSCERTRFRLRSRDNFTQLRLMNFYASKVFFSISNHWLGFSGPRCPKLCISSLFKSKTRSIFFPHAYHRLYDGSLSRRASVDHTPLRLEFSCVREYLFKINSCVSPICECSFDSESVKYFFLYCPSMPLNVMFSLPLLLIF